MSGDHDKTRAELIDEVQELRQRLGELEKSSVEHEQIMAKLMTSEALFRAVYENAPLMMDAFDKDGRCLLWNRACEQTFGWTMAELNAHDDPLSLFYPDPQIRKEVMESVTATPDGAFREWRPRTKEGTERTTLWANFQMPNGTVVNLGQDISEQRQAEEKLAAYREQLEQLVDERTTKLREANASLKQEITERKKAEEVLRQKDYIIESASNVIATADMHGKMTYVNPNFLETWGFSDSGEVLGRPFPEFWMVEERLDEIMDSLHHRGKWYSETQARKKDGSLFDVQVSAATVYDNEGRPISLMSSSVDITERKRAQEALRESEQTVRALVETSRDWIWAIDLEGRHTYCNPAIQTILGYCADELIGKRSLDLMHSDDRRMVEDKLPGLIAENQGWSNFLIRWRHKDGSWRFLESNAVPILGTEGELLGFRGVDRDITDRMRTEEELRDSVAKLRAIVDHSPALISVKDLDGNITLANRQFEVLAAPAPQEMIGKNVYDLFPHDIADELWRNDLAARSGPVETEESVPHKDGTQHTYLTVKFPLAGEDRTLLGTCAISTDISERKQNEEERLKLERQVQHSQKLESLGVLAGGIAHDFNNLLCVVLGNTELALDSLSKVSPAHPLIEEVDTAARRAAELTRQMLAYSGYGRFEVREVDLSELAEEMTQLIKSSISKNVEIEMDLRAQLPRVRADVAQLHQVVMNLITNAAEAIGEKECGTVKVSTGAMHCSRRYLSRSRLPERPGDGEFAYIQVVDSGCGMNEEVKEKLFDPFFTTKFTGRGLGMSAVLGIVRSHDGAIVLEGEPGKGTSIRVLFPVVEESAESTLEKNTDSEAAEWSGQGTVLVVDDEEGVRQMAKQMLKRLGFDVRIARNGHEAVEAFRQHSDEIVAVLLDLSMPRMDGQQACLELQRENPNVRVILASGYAEQDVANRLADKDGIVAFIHKPYRMDTLREKLRTVLEA